MESRDQLGSGDLLEPDETNVTRAGSQAFYVRLTAVEESENKSMFSARSNIWTIRDHSGEVSEAGTQESVN